MELYKNNMANLAKIFLILLLMLENLGALNLNGIESSAEIYKGSKAVSVKELNTTLFEPYNKSINIGLTNSEVWVKLNFFNKLNRDYNALAVFQTTHIDTIKVYEKKGEEFKLNNKLYQKRSIQGTLYPYFELKLKPNEHKTYYVNIKSSQIPSSFYITLADKNSFYVKDRVLQFIDIFIIGFLSAVAIYFIILYVDSQEKSYIYFSLFIFMALFYLLSYTGLTQIYATKNFIKLDKTLFIIKLNIMIVLSSLYSLLFLKLERRGFVHGLYIFIIVVSILEILMASFYDFSYYFVLLISGLYAVINIVAGFKAYISGLKEAKFYIIGAFVLAFGIYANIFNALNVDFIHINSSKFMIIFALSITFFIIAYIDRYWSIKKDEFNLFANSLDKKLILDNKIRKKQEELKVLENTKEILKQNINTIIKNNLQTTLSMLKLQEPKASNEKILAELKSLKNRLTVIVKTYSLFLSAKNPKHIIMKDYLQEIVDEILKLYDKNQKLKVNMDVDATLELENAIYVTIAIIDFIINNLNSNNSTKEYINIYLRNSKDKKYKFNINKICVKSEKNSFKLKKLLKFLKIY